jgi:ATP-dependent RNA helicase DDX60
MASLTLSDGLKELNVNWFTEIKPRWVDIIGSYAGKEHFLVDGDALLQYVLDDRLLGLGKEICKSRFHYDNSAAIF